MPVWFEAGKQKETVGAFTMTSLPYSETVMEHFKHPRNVGRMEDADAKSVEGSPACGDMVAVYLKVDEHKHGTMWLGGYMVFEI